MVCPVERKGKKQGRKRHEVEPVLRDPGPCGYAPQAQTGQDDVEVSEEGAEECGSDRAALGRLYP